MTDLETIKEILKKANITFDEIELSEEGKKYWGIDREIEVQHGGYNGFYCCLSFKPDGSLVKLGAYER